MDVGGWTLGTAATFADFQTGGRQWLKCNGTQGNAVPPPPIYGSKRSPLQIVMLVKGIRPLSGAQT